VRHPLAVAQFAVRHPSAIAQFAVDKLLTCFQLHRVSFVSKLEMASLARFTVTSAFAFGFRMGWFKLGESSLPNYLNPS